MCTVCACIGQWGQVDRLVETDTIIVLRYSSNDCTIDKMEDWDVDSGRMIAKVLIYDKTHQNTPFPKYSHL